MHRASCLCGRVRWHLTGPLNFMAHCHCSRCRKSRGTAFATEVAAPEGSLVFESGTEYITSWQSSESLRRCFCRHCGSVVPSNESWEGMTFAPAGNFEEDPRIRPVSHIFVASKAPWYEITDPLPRFDAFPPGVTSAVLDDPAPLDPPGGLRGSCMCGGSAYVVTVPPFRGHHCHCGRCRKGRGGAHASNMITTFDGVRLTRGAELLESYKVPDAQFFRQVFCRVCGAKMPNLDGDRGIAVIPMGSLDDDPKFELHSHIWTGSKAPWFEITDSLPQYAEGPPWPPKRPA